jgi:benzoyl-CoA-dihydrodiol lyase
VIDKRKVRRDLADVFATTAEGVRGERALSWGLVDELAPRSGMEEAIRKRAGALAALSDRPPAGPGVTLHPLEREITDTRVEYQHASAEIDRGARTVEITVRGPQGSQPRTGEDFVNSGDAAWALAAARQLDDLFLHLRTNEIEIGVWLLRTAGDPEAVAATDDTLTAHADHWLVREIIGQWRRTLKRLDVTSRSVIALIGPGSCFTGTLYELALAADRAYLLDAGDPPPAVRLTAMNFGPLPLPNGLTRLAARFAGDPDALPAVGTCAAGAAAAESGLVTFAPDDIDWDDEVRLAIEERASFSPDALTAMEANLRFGGPETLETKIFGRLSAWQNWVFSRPNAIGPDGALASYGGGHRATFDRKRV